MKSLWVLAFFSLIAFSNALHSYENMHGKNGWFVPERDGSFYWISKYAAKKLLGHLERETSFSSNPVDFYLFTKSSTVHGMNITASKESIRSSKFNSRHPTRIIIHGWFKSKTSEMKNTITDAWLRRGNFNVIVVEWARTRSFEYISSFTAVPTAGKKVADMINYLVSDHVMSLRKLHIIGHSLGAHVAGYAGKNTRGQVHTIIGLDPALPLFNYNKPRSRLSSADAAYVESIHTNAGWLGFIQPIGKAAFYPSGGKVQPGCGWDVLGACAHARAWQYYAEAVRSGGFRSIRCDDYHSATRKHCGSTYSAVHMGADANATGIFYVPVRSKAPFGRRH